MSLIRFLFQFLIRIVYLVFHLFHAFTFETFFIKKNFKLFLSDLIAYVYLLRRNFVWLSCSTYWVYVGDPVFREIWLEDDTILHFLQILQLNLVQWGIVSTRFLSPRSGMKLLIMQMHLFFDHLDLFLWRVYSVFCGYEKTAHQGSWFR